MANFSPEQLAEALHQALSNSKEHHHDTIIENLVNLLKESQALHLYTKIVGAYEKIVSSQQKNTITITTASGIAENPDLINSLNQALDSDVVIKEKIDKSIIGGIMVQVEDQLLDDSLKNKLTQLKKDLIS